MVDIDIVLTWTCSCDAGYRRQQEGLHPSWVSQRPAAAIEQNQNSRRRKKEVSNHRKQQC